MSDVIVSHSFHPVGQGLFSTGMIYSPGREGPLFVWIYDCGTTSSQSYLDDALHRFSTVQHVDLVTISHFDKDHISGMVKLLMRVSVEELLLPYMPLWQRLVLIIEAGITFRAPLARFLLDPVGFISEIPNANVKRILFSMPSSDAGESTDLPKPDGSQPLDKQSNTKQRKEERKSDNGRNGNRLEIEIEAIDETSLPPEDERRRYKEEVKAKSGIEVLYLRPGSAITVAGFWEFVPYNDASLAGKVSKSFKARVEKLRHDLLNEQDPDDKALALYGLKKAYIKTFGFGSEERNVISLFLYAGLINRDHYWGPSTSYTYGYARHAYTFGTPCGGVLYTGDGYLNNQSRFDALHQYLGEERMQSIHVLQVMHHGSRSNWFPGIAAKISPQYSVFCSDPAHRGYKHPHAEVLRDFWGFGPVQVDKDNRVDFEMHL
ncbi:hypothetical protein APB30_28180 [Pseudomonas aeruginosa]|uniref:hypothetical protein n=1 Tax=Pseudomonas aeruginosa TaxID=287 RepID=UPI0005B4A010|nr:hypothetical protein [Pseudomonas aeruginosa]KSI04354.1 hypothetical protein AO984_27750 [Pseudomonas aeruginosa]KSK78054.1 hypothetical protein APA36_04070 [Pseudomonas aeruginosa]KSQ27157.1 hypothetical protein APB30_28180 [Pseudomonas aeruginosa]MBH3728058.1 hypothetical protein [Pseudomonas aeruginosa]MBH3775844.1 hypothetical protein [Pseudomonas aeruginosa]